MAFDFSVPPLFGVGEQKEKLTSFLPRPSGNKKYWGKDELATKDVLFFCNYNCGSRETERSRKITIFPRPFLPSSPSIYTFIISPLPPFSLIMFQAKYGIHLKNHKRLWKWYISTLQVFKYRAEFVFPFLSWEIHVLLRSACSRYTLAWTHTVGLG